MERPHSGMFHPQTAFVVRLLCTGTIDPTLDDKILAVMRVHDAACPESLQACCAVCTAPGCHSLVQARAASEAFAPDLTFSRSIDPGWAA